VAGAELAFGHLQDFLMVLATDDASLYSSHVFLSCEPLGAGSSSSTLWLPVVHTQRPH
jgi:hypothetical protein